MARGAAVIQPGGKARRHVLDQVARPRRPSMLGTAGPGAAMDRGEGATRTREAAGAGRPGAVAETRRRHVRRVRRQVHDRLPAWTQPEAIDGLRLRVDHHRQVDPVLRDTDIARIDAVAVDAYISHATAAGLVAEDGEEPPRRAPRDVQGRPALAADPPQPGRRRRDAPCRRTGDVDPHRHRDRRAAGDVPAPRAGRQTATRTGGGSLVTSSSSRSAPRCDAARSSASAGAMSSCSTGAYTSAKPSSAD